VVQPGERQGAGHLAASTMRCVMTITS
jgi:hypothetical protein